MRFEAFAIALLIILVAPVACFESSQHHALGHAYPAGMIVDPSALGAEIAFDSGRYDDFPIRVSLVGYSGPFDYLSSGERLVIVVKGEYAVYLFIDSENRVLRSEVVGS